MLSMTKILVVASGAAFLFGIGVAGVVYSFSFLDLFQLLVSLGIGVGTGVLFLGGELCRKKDGRSSDWYQPAGAVALLIIKFVPGFKYIFLFSASLAIVFVAVDITILIVRTVRRRNT